MNLPKEKSIENLKRIRSSRYPTLQTQPEAVSLLAYNSYSRQQQEHQEEKDVPILQKPQLHKVDEFKNYRTAFNGLLLYSSP